MLSKGAFNALLKTLEEPPAHVKFIFATTEIRKVPVTILSRCQRFDLQRLSVATLKELFVKILTKENIPSEDEALEVIAKAADGSARDGLSLLDQSIVLSNGDIKTDVVKKMLGLADRSQTLNLFANLINGDMENVLNNVMEQYTNGATSLIVLQDLINITHDLAKVKIIPQILNSTSLSEVEKQIFTDLSQKTSLAILSKVWQMLIKGVGEINMAPSSVEALEMILLRVAYSASLPTPYEILNEVKKKSNLTPDSQTALPEIEKKNNKIEPENVREKLIFDNVEDFIQYLEKSRKVIIEYSVKNDISFEEFEHGKIKIRISENIKQDFIMELHKVFQDATGIKWQIEIIKGDLGETIADKEQSTVDAKKKNVAEYPLVKKILEEFKGARIETIIRKNLSELEKEERDISIDMASTYFEEEE